MSVKVRERGSQSKIKKTECYYNTENISPHSVQVSYLPLIPHSLCPVPTSQGEFESHSKTFLACWASCSFLRETLCLRRLTRSGKTHSMREHLQGWPVTITQQLVAPWVRFCSWNSKILPLAERRSCVYLTHVHVTSTWRSALYLAEEWEILCSCMNERKILKKCSRKSVWC